MKQFYSRRNFVKKSAINALGVGIAGNISFLEPGYSAPVSSEKAKEDNIRRFSFVPNRSASWWADIRDILWPEKDIVDKIKRRAEAFAKAKIDTAINFGFHIRFDFSDYFGQLHGYYANVCEELHQYGIKFIDHYSCNHVERPRGEAEFRKLHQRHRHHVLLFHDPVAAEHAQYEGHFFHDLCEIDLIDGSRGYSKQYQMEAFCHNNPGFLDMHTKYLKRLLKEVPLDGIEVDDMCDYPGLTTCGCGYCRDRLQRDYGREIPPFEDKNFWGDTGKPMLSWGNYENPAFRDWMRMKADSVADHVKLVKNVIGDLPLMTCSSSSGPVKLNAITLNVQRMAPYLDILMLENVGFNIHCINWVRMDAEAMQQKDIARTNGNLLSVALSYTIYEPGGYLGWCLSRFWGVGNWSSTLTQRLETDPVDSMEIEDIIGAYNNWEIENSKLNYFEGVDLAEVRLVSSHYCRDNGWRDDRGFEQWDKVATWSANLVRRNINYRILGAKELADPEMLCKEDTPLILDGVGCMSDDQFKAVKIYLSKGGTAWLALPFGTHDEKGFKRAFPLSEELLSSGYKNLSFIDTASAADPLEKLIREGLLHPVIEQLSGDDGWAVRIRYYGDKPAIHFLNTALEAVAHPELKDFLGIPVLKDVNTKIGNNNLTYKINRKKVPVSNLSVMSPELGQVSQKAELLSINENFVTINVNLQGVKVYAVVQTV